MPLPVQFVAHTHKKIEALKEEETYNTVHQAIEISNKSLDADEVSVVFIQQLSSQPPEKPKLLDARYNMLLGIRVGDQEEPIDMIDLKALDEVSIKSVDDLAKEIVHKVKQHLVAKKIAEIIFSTSGSKLDTRLLKNHTVSIDAADYLTVDNCRIVVETSNKEYWVLQAPNFRSYTIVRLINEGNKIRVFDDYDLFRENKKGMLIDASRVHHLAIEQLVERSRPSAESYNGEYFLVERDEITQPIAHRLYEKSHLHKSEQFWIFCQWEARYEIERIIVDSAVVLEIHQCSAVEFGGGIFSSVDKKTFFLRTNAGFCFQRINRMIAFNEKIDLGCAFACPIVEFALFR